MATPAASHEISPDLDQRIVLDGVSWEQYEALLSIFGDDFPGIRMAYLEGALEIMSPSRTHERIKKTVARLIELYALERWRRGAFELYRLGPTGYARVERSELLRGLDFVFHASLVEEPDQTRALHRLRDALRAGG